MSNIPEYSIDKQAQHGVLIASLENIEQYQKHEVGKPHRDDHFTILVITSGFFELMLDFRHLILDKQSIVVIRPEQVHHIIGMSKATGWLLNVGTQVISPNILAQLYAHILNPIFPEQNSVLTDQILSLPEQISALLLLQKDPFIQRASLRLVDALFELLIAVAISQKPVSERGDRAKAIYQQFQSLLQEHFKEWKQPHLYALELSLSPVHVNDIVRKQSGHSVSYHIQARNVLEAKRLLFYTDKNVNEIGYMLGYEDALYFGKLFKKHTQISPTQFRFKHRI